MHSVTYAINSIRNELLAEKENYALPPLDECSALDFHLFDNTTSPDTPW